MSQDNVGLCICSKPLKKRTPAALSNPPGLLALKYRVGTHSQFKADMLEMISRQHALKNLTTREDDDLAIALLDGWATIADVLTFYQERIINEGYLRTATERRSVLELAKTIGYTLKPGVAASTHLAFMVETSEGSPQQSRVDEGTKIMSVPGQDEKLQIFETIETIEAKTALNDLKPLQFLPIKMEIGLTELYLKGVNTHLAPGDAILLVGSERIKDVASENWDFRFLQTVTENPDKNYTHITWKKDLGHAPKTFPAAKPMVFAFKQRASFFGYNAPDWKTMPDNVKAEYVTHMNVSFFGDAISAAGVSYDWGSEWPSFDKICDFLPSAKLSGYVAIHLDAAYPKILPESWVVFAGQQKKDSTLKLYYVALGQVKKVEVDAQTGFTLTSKTTKLELDITYTKLPGNQGPKCALDGFMRRDTVVFCVNESFEIADKPFMDLVFGNTIVLDRKVSELKVGQKIIVQGKVAKLKVIKKTDLFSSDGGLKDAEEFLFLAPPVAVSNVVGVDDAKRIYRYKLLTQDGTAVTLKARSVGGRGQPDIEPSAVRDMLLSSSLDGKKIVKSSTKPKELIGGLMVVAPLGEDDPVVCEVAVVKSLGFDEKLGVTLVDLVVPCGKDFALSNVYDLGSVHIYANVALATHGESTHETLGSGDSLGINQQFCLKKLPLTYVSAMSASGAKSTLKVFVNDVLWPEVSSFCFLGPKDPGYVVRMEDDGDTWVGFGDGKTGVRLPSGSENVVASYRSGIGFQGAVAANRLTLLAKKPFGIHSVTNPIAASGAASPEKMEDAKVNAPSTVLTLGRIVSLGDYENFARNFLGIAKARAVVELEGTDSVVCLIVAPLDAKPLVSTSMLYLNLDAAVKRACAVGQKVYIKSFTPKYFDVTCTLYVDLNYSFEEVKANVKAALLGAFSFERRFFKQAVTKVDVLSVIQLVPGVIYVPASLLFLTVVVDVAGAGVEGGLENPSDDGVLFMVNPEGITLEVKH